MAMKTSELPTRIWSFHAEPPVAMAEQVREILFFAHRYRNALVEVERDRLSAIEQARRASCGEYREAAEHVERLSGELDATYEELRAGRSGTGKRETPPEIRGRLDAVKAQRTEWAKRANERRKELDRETGAAARAFDERTSGAPRELLDRMAQLRADIRAAKKAKLGHDVATAELERLVRQKRDISPKTHKKAAANARVFAEMSAEEWPQLWKDTRAIDAQATERMKQERANCGVPCGTYVLVEASVKAAVKAAFPDAPRFKRFEGEGKIGVQGRVRTRRGEKIPMRFADLLDGADATLRLRQQERGERRSGKHDGEFWILDIRIDSESGSRKPVFASFPVRLHRRPPDDAVIKWAWVKVERHGQRLRYQFQLTLESDAFSAPHRMAVGVGNVRPVFGARERETDIVVAEDGNDKIVLPKRIADGLTFPESLLSEADGHYETIRRYLGKWTHMGGNRLTHWRRRKHGAPVRKQSQATRRLLASNCEKWASHEVGDEPRLSRLWYAWREHCGAVGSERRGTRAQCDLFAPLHVMGAWCRTRGLTRRQAFAFWCYAWSRKDKHLRQLAADTRRRATNQRDACYRAQAIEWAVKYERLVTDNKNLADAMRKPSDEQGHDGTKTLRSLRHHVAPGRCREILREVFGARHMLERSGDAQWGGVARSSEQNAESDASRTSGQAAE